MSDTTMPRRAGLTNRPRPATWLRPAIAGAVGALAGIGLSELVAGFLTAPSLLASIGSFLVDNQPAGAKDVAVGLFGTNDKLAFEIVIVLIAGLIGAGLGLLAARRTPALAAVGFGAFAVAGFFASLRSPGSTPTTSMVVALIGGVGGYQVLAYLLHAGDRRRFDPDAPAGSMPDWSRRSFLIQAGTVTAAATAAGLIGRRLLESARSSPTVATTIPGAAVKAVLPAGAELAVARLTPLVVPNEDFYRIDTAFLVPNVDVAGWRLKVTGMVDREVVLTFNELVQLPMIEQYVTISCVSNEVGGNLVGNANWTGVRLRDVLAMAGVQAGATQLVGRAVDGWTAGMPTEWVMNSAREPMIAVKMNDEILPRVHGFPARLIVPGLYGYVSATKWLSELQLTTLEGFNGYWVPLGWSKYGPILTQSRIDVPRQAETVTGNRVAIAGVAWAPDRGISRVEIAIDGQWRDCQLSTPISKATWVQWLYAWDASASGPGAHTIEVRATDGTGEVQTTDRTRPAPDGARGHQTITVNVG
jgi:DMSO/TMAO reductase YedYZ molybdopterin-dependent catalytic subunit